MLDSSVMPILLQERTDALCRRQCSFALYALPGEEIRFCMQKDGGMHSGSEGEGFVIATYNGELGIIRSELSEPPEASAYAILPPRKPPEEETTRCEYHRLFELYTAQLHGEHALGKLVLARTEDVPAPDFSPTRALQTLCNTNPNAFNALFHSPEHGTWLCSTPELLLQRQGTEWHTMALAGSRVATQEPWDAKNINEHAPVAQHIRECIAPIADTLHEHGPYTVSAGRMLEHLRTDFSFTAAAKHLSALLQALPPTPAVSGFPALRARAFLAAHPDINRSCYAGYIGPVSKNSTHLYVTLRCMQVFPSLCRLYAGGGLMPDSVEANEWAETVLKMQNMLRLIIP